MAGDDGDIRRRFEERLLLSRKSSGNSFITLASTPRSTASGQLSGTLAGIKDNIAVKGMRMTCGSRILENYMAPYDATVVERLKDSGAAVLGKNNMDEFACGSSGENSAFGATRNPLIPGTVSGGSSSGSAASVSEGLVDFSIGSDTGGSIRCPAAYCGVIALKPTYGRVSRYGLADLSMSLEGPAPVAAWGGEELLATVMDCISGFDLRDQSTASARKTECVKRLDSFDPSGLNIAVPENALLHCTPQVVGAFERALSFLGDAGAAVERVQLKSLDVALSAYYLIMYSEFASAMQRYDGLKFGTRGEGYSVEESILNARSLLGPEVRRRIMIGTYVTSAETRAAWYERALAARDHVSSELNGMLNSHDLLAMPTMPAAPYRLGERINDPLLMYASDILTVPANLAGVPAGSMPMGPGLGFQLVAPRNGDESILAAFRFFHGRGWHW